MRFAILGYGFMGAAHLAAMRRIDGVEVKAVAARTRPSADTPARGNLALESGPPPESVAWVADWREAVASPDIDAVDVCLPTDLHCEVVTAALAAGKHVLCEKPMALTVEDCDTMMAAAAASGRVFMVGQVLRFMFPYIEAEAFVRKAGRGSVQSAALRRSTGFPGWGGWLQDADRSGGAILDLLSHDLDQALHLFGQPETVRAATMGPVDTGRAVLQYKDGLCVEVEGGWTEPDQAFSASFDIRADDSSLTFSDGALRRIEGGREQTVPIPGHDAYHDQIAYFVECCQRGIAPQRCPPAASADAVRISLLLKESRDGNGRELAWDRQ